MKVHGFHLYCILHLYRCIDVEHPLHPTHQQFQIDIYSEVISSICNQVAKLQQIIFFGVTLYVLWYICFATGVVTIKTKLFVPANKFFILRWIDINFILNFAIHIIKLIKSFAFSLNFFQNHLFRKFNSYRQV